MVKLEGFNAAKVEPKASFKPLPIGDYTVLITSTEVKEAKTGNGNYMKVQMQVVDGQHKGRNVFVNLNLWNKNDQAKAIAQSELSSICRAIGILQPLDSSELHSKPFVVTLSIEEQKGRDPQNRVKEYKSLKDSKENKPSQEAASLSEPVEKAPWE